MIHGGQVLSTETIVEQVWGYDGRGDKELVRGLVRRLRQKIEPNPTNPSTFSPSPASGTALQPTTTRQHKGRTTVRPYHFP